MLKIKSHYVSQLLLKRFSINGKVKVKNLRANISYLKKPKNIAFLDFPSKYFVDAEKEWCSKYESKVGEAYRLLLKGDLLKHKKHMHLLIKLMSLLFIRSLATYVSLGIRADEKMIELKRILIPMGIDEAKIERDWIQKVVIATPKTINDLLIKVETFLLKHNLEVGVSHYKNKLILSDVPVINTHLDGRTGVLSGVSLMNSNSVILPLTPNHVIAITSRPAKQEYIFLDKKAVKKLNKLSKVNSIKEFYCLPD